MLKKLDLKASLLQLLSIGVFYIGKALDVFVKLLEKVNILCVNLC